MDLALTSVDMAAASLLDHDNPSTLLTQSVGCAGVHETHEVSTVCGIAGAITSAATRDADGLQMMAQVMARAIQHRGPDDAGTWVDAERGVGMGHRRLAVLDPTTAGHQPMVSADGRMVLTFNGEIYNHQELRDRLPTSRYRSDCDTESLVEAIATWGLHDALRAATGMFALAVWDREARKLSLARDRIGEKPLYYGWQNRTFLFGSELRALEAHPEFNASVDEEAVALIAKYGHVPAPRSIYHGIRKLEPGSILEVDPNHVGSAGTRASYWSLRAVVNEARQDPIPKGAPWAADLLHDTLRTAVGRQMIADVPLGAFLSGGIDSSTVVALMQSLTTRPVRTFSIGFREPHYDEAPHAAAIAAHLGTDHTELYVTPQEAQSVVPQLATVYDEPFADSSQLPTTLVARMTRDHVTVALSGDGGDELFGGYPRYELFAKFWRLLTLLPRPARLSLAKRLGRMSPVRARQLQRLVGSVVTPVQRVRPEQIPIQAQRTLELGDPVAAYDHLVYGRNYPSGLVPGVTPGNELAAPVGPPSGLSAREIAMFIDTMNYLPNDILEKVDRAAMSTSLETRVPMLDPAMISLAWRLPAQHRQPSRDGLPKPLLREVLYRYVPRQLVDRPKSGFGVPVGGWIKDPLREWAEDLLSVETLRRDGMFDSSVVADLWAEHLRGERSHTPVLWSILMTTQWLRR